MTGLKPILKAMLVCDHTLVEQGTHKRSLIGIFDNIHAGSFPVSHDVMSVYVQFREVQGVFDFALELCDLEKGRAVHRAVIHRFKVPDRSRDCELVFELRNVRFEHAGDYEFRIFIDELIFGQKSLQVTKKEAK